MLGWVTVLFVCQFVGECVARLTGLPVPGSVLGMVLLFFALVMAKRRIPAGLDSASSSLLRYLLLLFVPAGVGLYVHWREIARELIPIGGAVLLGTIVTIGFTGLIVQALLRSTAATAEDREGTERAAEGRP